MKIIVGGSGFSINPIGAMSFLQIEYGISGEGEVSFNEFLEYLDHKRGINTVSNLIYKKNNKYKINPIKKAPNLNILAKPDYDLIDYKSYVDAGDYIGIQTKRSCGFHCSYCTYPFLEGSMYRTKNPKSVVAEIKEITKTTHRNKIMFVDNVFTFPGKHAYLICKEIIKTHLNIRWIAYANPAGITLPLLKIIKKSGCIGLVLTIDSASDKILTNLGKGFDAYQVNKTINLIKKVKLPFAVLIIIGSPGETMETIKITVDNLKKHSTINALFVNFGIELFPNTPIWKKMYSGKNNGKLRFINFIDKTIHKQIKEIHNSFLSISYCISTPYGNSMFYKIFNNYIPNKFKIRPEWKYNYLRKYIINFEKLFTK